MNRRVSVRAIVLQDGKLLCVRQKSYRDPTNKVDNDFWNIPGGGLDQGESLTDCLCREMLEETGVPAVVGNLMYIQQFQYGDIEYLEFFFHVTNTEDYINIDLTKTTHGVTEIAEITFIDPTKSNVLPKFLTTEAIQQQTTAPTKIFSYL